MNRVNDYAPDELQRFVFESNRIEGINGTRPEEIQAHAQFLDLPTITIASIIELVRVLQPDARLRDRKGLNVRVGSHVPMLGGPKVYQTLTALLLDVNGVEPTSSAVRLSHFMTPHEAHVAYEDLHPFTDGNGRTGRAIWAWQMLRLPGPGISRGFLHQFYYQTLERTNR